MNSPAPGKPEPESSRVGSGGAGMAPSGGPRVSPRVRARRRILAVWSTTALVLAGAITVGTVRTGPEPKTDFWATLKSQLQPLPARDVKVNTPPPAAVDLSGEIKRILAENPDYRIGVVVQDTRGGEPQRFGDTADYTAASTAKILTAVAYYALVERGERSLDTPLGSYDAGFQIQAMVNTSSDDSWLLLMNDIGYPELIKYAASIGISYDPEKNLLTPVEMASLLKQLYAGQLLSPEHTEELLGFMQHTNDEELIPAAVPEGVTVSHKYGLLEGFVHDAAVLSSGNAAYAVAIYTWGGSDADSPERIEVFHELTTAVTGALFRR
ncbi:serine hydrolase [Arthrobacter sp. 1P04PC]|uniref:serine hydrolase n=1 Tax=unclassified Arthrobacter TaxID=235627 RepID=UPI00399F79EE